ncbi:helix-turn-helix domain-containing protein, partial [Streptomyces scabiei]
PSGRTDLSDLVRVRRATAGLSLEAVAAATVTPGSEERLIEADWLDRLERATLSPDEYPEYPQLDALINVLNLDPNEAQEAAGAQFMDVHTVWSEDGQVRAVVTGELDAEDLAKVHNLMRLYRQAPRR